MLFRSPFVTRRLRVQPMRVGSVGSAPSARHVGGWHVWGIEWVRCGSRAVAGYSQRGPLARHVTEEYSGGTPRMGTVRGYGRGTSLLWVRRSTAERPSPLRMCSQLYNNALTGSVPSSLSALTKLELLCVPPSCQRRLRVRPRRVGSVGSAPSARRAACRGHRAGASRGAVRQQGLLRYSQRGASGTRCDY